MASNFDVKTRGFHMVFDPENRLIMDHSWLRWWWRMHWNRLQRPLKKHLLIGYEIDPCWWFKSHLYNFPRTPHILVGYIKSYLNLSQLYLIHPQYLGYIRLYSSNYSPNFCRFCTSGSMFGVVHMDIFTTKMATRNSVIKHGCLEHSLCFFDDFPSKKNRQFGEFSIFLIFSQL